MKKMLWQFAVLIGSFLCSSIQAEETTQVLIVVGPSNHPPGTHEVMASGRVLEHCLENLSNVANIEASVVNGWPNAESQKTASTVVFLGDTFPAHRFPNSDANIKDLSVMMDRGCGIVCLHFATGLLGQDVPANGDHPLLRWMGGYYANRTCTHHQSIARIFKAAKIEPVGKHPILNGWNEFTIHDEPYINNYFGPQNNEAAANVTILATSLLPPENPKPERIAWCVERPDSGRGFGIVMPHFYRNWGDENLRTFILNGIVWSAKREIPQAGVSSSLKDLTEFQPQSVEPQPAK